MDSEITQRLIPAFGGDDNIEPAIRVIRARRLEQHGPGQVLQWREQRTGWRISRQGQCAEMK